MLRLQNLILRKIVNGDPLDETLVHLCRAIEAYCPEVICTVIGVDAAGLFRPLAAPSLPDAFSEAIKGKMIGPLAGSCGTAAYLRAPVLVQDIARDPRWARYRDLAIAEGLKACWSSPVCNESGTILGVIALYFRELRGPSKAERAAMSLCVDLCEMALRRQERVDDRERRAHVDGLTGLPNRAAFNHAMAGMACDEPGQWGLLVIDLDNLKVVNDTFGHQAGDALICAAAKRIRERMSPDVTFRLGGDEFAVIVQDNGALRDLEGTAARIFEMLERPAQCEDHMVVPSATIGGAVLGGDHSDATSVYRNADFALYHAKETGRGGFVRYWPGIDTRITNRRSAIRDVTEALADNRIDAHYQPIIRLDTREIVGVEALCRLTTTAGKMISAQDFKDATLDAQVATGLTERMLSIVAQDARRWLDDGVSFGAVGINVSAADFYAGALDRHLETTFGQAGVPFGRLVIEVSENVYLGRQDGVVERTIHALRTKGLRVALDDFGTGYASLTHLLNVPVDGIKIDRSFTTRLLRDDPSTAVMEGLIEIARRLGIAVVAEAVETDRQADQLAAMGCQLGQGFAFAPALDRSAVAELLRRHGSDVKNFTPLQGSAQSATNMLRATSY